jgi:hypothetical protein
MKAEFLDSLGLSFYYLDAAFLAVPHRAAGVELVGREPTDAKARKPHGLESTEQAEARQSCPSTPRDWYSRTCRCAKDTGCPHVLLCPRPLGDVRHLFFVPCRSSRLGGNCITMA